ncbi:hypothetical protein Tco_0191348 [Tanacetum coccineum]
MSNYEATYPILGSPRAMTMSPRANITCIEDPYAEAALHAPPSPDYVPGPEEPEQAPPSPDYVPGPELADDEIVLEYEDWTGAVADINEDGFCVLSKVYETFIILKNLSHLLHPNVTFPLLPDFGGVTNLSSFDPVDDAAGPSYDSDFISEITTIVSMNGLDGVMILVAYFERRRLKGYIRGFLKESKGNNFTFFKLRYIPSLHRLLLRRLVRILFRIGKFIEVQGETRRPERELRSLAVSRIYLFVGIEFHIDMITLAHQPVVFYVSTKKLHTWGDHPVLFVKEKAKVKLYAKFSKLRYFGLQEVQFIGHVVNHDGTPTWTLAMVGVGQDWKEPLNRQLTIRSFLGLAGYYTLKEETMHAPVLATQPMGPRMTLGHIVMHQNKVFGCVAGCQRGKLHICPEGFKICRQQAVDDRYSVTIECEIKYHPGKGELVVADALRRKERPLSLDELRAMIVYLPIHYGLKGTKILEAHKSEASKVSKAPTEG